MKTKALSDYVIGYSRLETSHDTRFANERTKRARMISGDGSRDRELGPEIVTSCQNWTQCQMWMTDGTAVVVCGWQSDEMAAREQSERRFIVTNESRHMDVWLVSPESGAATNVSEPDRVSSYNDNVSEWPRDRSKLALSFVNDGRGSLCLMNRDGTGKIPLAPTEGYAYGICVSPDGNTAAWHEDYQIKIHPVDGGVSTVETGRSFNFGPQWSPDGRHLLFQSGASNIGPSIYIASADGTGVRFASSRSGYVGVASAMDDGDYRLGDTDMPRWHPDGGSFWFTARASDGNVELFRYSLKQGRRRRVTYSPPGSRLANPEISADGQWVAVAGLIDGARNIYVVGRSHNLIRVTNCAPGTGAILPVWRPLA